MGISTESQHARRTFAGRLWIDRRGSGTHAKFDPAQDHLARSPGLDRRHRSGACPPRISIRGIEARPPTRTATQTLRYITASETYASCLLAPWALAWSCRSTAIEPRLNSTNGSSGRSASSASRILLSRWSFRSRSARVGIASVPDCDIGPPHWHVRPPQCRQDLLVHRIAPAHVLAHREKPDMIEHRLSAIPVRPRITRAPHHIRRRPIHVVAMGWLERPPLVGWVERPREAHRRASAPTIACSAAPRTTRRVGRASSRGPSESLGPRPCRPAIRPASSATFPAPAGQPRHRHRARTHSHPWPAPAPRCGPRRSRRPRRNQTPGPRTRGRSPACGPLIPYQRPRSHQRGPPRTISISKCYFLHPSRSWSTRWWFYQSKILGPRMKHGMEHRSGREGGDGACKPAAPLFLAADKTDSHPW